MSVLDIAVRECLYCRLADEAPRVVSRSAHQGLLSMWIPHLPSNIPGTRALVWHRNKYWSPYSAIFRPEDPRLRIIPNLLLN